MALVEEYTVSIANQFVQDLAAFLTANGASVDFSGVYNTSYYRVHAHIGGVHFEFYSTSSVNVYYLACTGYSNGVAPTSQPNVSTIRGLSLTVGGKYVFVSTPGSLHFFNASNGSYYPGAVGIIAQQIGGYQQGYFIMAASSGAYTVSCYTSAAGASQLYYNGGWTTYNTQAGALIGDVGGGEGISIAKQPNDYNGAIHPFGITAYVINSQDTTKYHPIGVFPNVFKGNAGNVFSLGEQITSGSDTYVVYPKGASDVGSATTGDLFFKLGSLQ